MIRALNDRSMEVQRRTVVVIDNLVKLVRDPKVAATYLSPLVEGVQKIATGAAFPEVRAFAEASLKTLLKSGASINGPPSTHRDIKGQTAEALSTLLSQLPVDLLSGKAPKYSLLAKSLEFQASLVADLIYSRNFDDKAIWGRCVGAYMVVWSDAERAATFGEAVRLHYLAIDKVYCYISHLCPSQLF